ncbi:hypothetical protein J6590_057922 [Homalodisca vitripennis]|nr:hypothetical protein J6590_057922 [Homalodisca vitripennis]
MSVRYESTLEFYNKAAFGFSANHGEAVRTRAFEVYFDSGRIFPFIGHRSVKQKISSTTFRDLQYDLFFSQKSPTWRSEVERTAEGGTRDADVCYGTIDKTASYNCRLDVKTERPRDLATRPSIQLVPFSLDNPSKT